ncbi:hypothetical protein [Sphingomonas sp. PP-F2F-A104-K0414]|uniref:hypothetical protein n=1 Tax=Sphingomonas sp. PP-F2F-A104-K0414 TaxID=2135661 RepID=UPI0010531E8E|nr:hypothetical protein [Sphingomonas sp. PP-F2F-A104-K0414]
MLTRSQTAVSLMKMALALLDRDRADLAACHLHRAIEVAEDDVEIGSIATRDAAATEPVDKLLR